MRVKIIKSADIFWYHKYIGKELKVYSYDEEDYMISEKPRWWEKDTGVRGHCIFKTDCEILSPVEPMKQLRRHKV